MWHWLTLSKHRDHPVGGQPLLQQQYYVKIPQLQLLCEWVTRSQQCVDRVLQLQKQILQSVLVPGDGTLSVTFQAYQTLSRLCDPHVPRPCWWSTSVSSCASAPASTFKLPAEPPPPPTFRSKQILTQQKADMDLSLCPVLPVSRTLTGDPLSLEGWEQGAGSTVNAGLDWDLGSWEARSEPWAICHVPRPIPEWIIPGQGGVWQHVWCPIMFIRVIYINVKSTWMLGWKISQRTADSPPFVSSLDRNSPSAAD